jgi:hypothetical protein
MIDLKLDAPVTETVEVDDETRGAIERGTKDADEGRTVSIDEVRRMIPEWFSNFESRISRVSPNTHRPVSPTES